MAQALRIARVARCSRLLVLAATVAAARSRSRPSSTSSSSRARASCPVYEGWERAPDGSFNMVFGYLNRNHVRGAERCRRRAERLRTRSGRSRSADVFLPAREPLHLHGERPEGLGPEEGTGLDRSPRTARPRQARATLLDVWEIDRKVEVVEQRRRRADQQRAGSCGISRRRSRSRRSAGVQAPGAGDAQRVGDRRRACRRRSKPRTPRPLEPTLRGAPPSPVRTRRLPPLSQAAAGTCRCCGWCIAARRRSRSIRMATPRWRTARCT